MAEIIHEFISEEKVNERIREIGAQITKDYEGEELYVITIMKGAIYFATELTKRIEVPVILDFMAASSYGADTKSSGVVKITRDLDESLAGKNVIVVEDIIDTGRTLSYLLELLKKRNPKSIKLCTLLDKPDRRIAQVDVDYVGFVVPDEFIVGYGLDYAQKYRNLPFIGTLEFK
ncbi:hypoxanthine phosphoribosyltransferase [Eubacterium oxidoreducens]|uniref:Hypoxanthine phosphoribosyltransferase n=1 Tax=Eubacterium oxidoreducens TaxID=1732 RepID=A0A1G6BWY2_EUBOX|nr:hypoxanthine phosphoribosyltransferase [Eubacterium oxidoreducens]SDB25047.1 hypoxanthine phosphoribosyltransferase [Eubacterium oxidoreducens]